VKTAPPTPDRSTLARHLLVAVAILSFSVGGSSLRSEVSVVTDNHGRYVRTVILSEVRGGKRLNWSPIRAGKDPRLLLNPTGDTFGDGPPEFKEQPGSRQPWVVWSASDGHDREIVFATWSMGRWLGPMLLEKTDNPYDDLNPRLAFDAEARPVVVWWRNEPTPKVYLSAYRGSTWTQPLPLTDAAVSGRFLSLRIQGNQAVITFNTSRGQTVLYQDLSQLSVQMDGNGPLDGPVPPPTATPNPSDPATGGPSTTNCSPECPGSDIIVQKPHTDDNSK